MKLLTMKEAPTVDASNWKMLACPVCEMEYLHHHRIEDVRRDEDAKKARCVSIDLEKVVVETANNDETPNPSSRRSGFVVTFDCEMGHRVFLNFAQHKGSTLMYWSETYYDLEQEEMVWA